MGAAPVTATPSSPPAVRSQGVLGEKSVPVPADEGTRPVPAKGWPEGRDPLSRAKFLYQAITGTDRGFDEWLNRLFQEDQVVTYAEFKASFKQTPINRKLEISRGAWRYLFGNQDRGGGDDIHGRDQFLAMCRFAVETAEVEAAVNNRYGGLMALGAFYTNMQGIRGEATATTLNQLLKYEGAWRVETGAAMGALAGDGNYLSPGLGRQLSDYLNIFEHRESLPEPLKPAYDFMASRGYPTDKMAVDPAGERELFAQFVLAAVRQQMGGNEETREGTKRTEIDRLFGEINEIDEDYRKLQKELADAESALAKLSEVNPAVRPIVKELNEMRKAHALKGLAAFPDSKEAQILKRFGVELHCAVTTGTFVVNIEYIRTGRLDPTKPVPEGVLEGLEGASEGDKPAKKEEVHAHE